MSKKTAFVCSYANCPFPDKLVNVEDAVKIGARYRHKTCDEIAKNCAKIRDTYVGIISSNVVMTQLNSVIKNLVFKKLKNDNLSPDKSALEASRFLLFALNYAINNRMRINSPYAMHYLIDNERVKKAWEEKSNQTVEKELRKSAIDFSDSKTTEYVPKEKIKSSPFGFENIFKVI